MEIVKKYALLFLCILLFYPPAHAKKRAPKSATVQWTPPAPTASRINVYIEDSNIETFLKWVQSQDSEYEQSTIFLFDNQDLTLLHKGLALQLRRLQDETYETVVKVRNIQSEKLPGLSRSSIKNFKCEKELAQGSENGMTCTLSVTSKKILKSVTSERADSFFSSDQLKLVKWKVESFKIDDLKPYGRLIENRWEISKDNSNFDCELWTLPSKQRRFLECEATAKLDETDKKQESLVSLLQSGQLKVTPRATPKAEVALTYLQQTEGSLK